MPVAERMACKRDGPVGTGIPRGLSRFGGAQPVGER